MTYFPNSREIVPDLQYASMVEAVREAHWLAELIFFVILVLFLFSLYLTTRYLITPGPKIRMAPAHIQNATPILKWIAVTSILLAIISGGVDAYSYLLELGMAGRIGFDSLASVLAVLILFAILGSVVALTTMLEIAAIYTKNMRNGSGTRG